MTPDAVTQIKTRKTVHLPGALCHKQGVQNFLQIGFALYGLILTNDGLSATHLPMG